MPISSKKATKRGLGRSFESLIPTDLLDESFDPTASQDHAVSELRQIRLDEIIADPDQPRKLFEEGALEELAASIKEHGVVQPIIVTPYDKGYMIVAGERRYRASKMIGLEKIPALVRTLTAQRKLELSLIENLQRQDLNVMEIATAYLKLRDQFNLSLGEIGKRVGNLSPSAVSNRLRLLKAPANLRELLASGQITEGQARPLIGVDEDIIQQVIPRIVDEDWSSRKVEQFVVNLKKSCENERSSRNTIHEHPYNSQIKGIQDNLKTEVMIRTNSRGAGQISIKFKTEEEFERIHKLLIS